MLELGFKNWVCSLFDTGSVGLIFFFLRINFSDSGDFACFIVDLEIMLHTFSFCGIENSIAVSMLLFLLVGNGIWFSMII